jgi:hypothetical protein
MSFSVTPAVLDGYAGQVGRAGDDSGEIKRYLDGFPSPSGLESGVLIAVVFGSHSASMAAAVDVATRISTVLHSSQIGLTGAAQYYRRTDVAAAARLDGTLLGFCDSPDTKLEQEWASNPCGPSFFDSREPTGRLKPVGDVEFSHPLAFMDYLSPSDWALKGFDFVFGFNPMDKVSDYFLGDWQAIAKAGVALGQTADAMHDIGYNVQGGAIALRGGWHGGAADLADHHFTTFAGQTADLADPLKQISERFAEMAQGVYNSCEAITGFIKGLLDAAIVAGIAAAAGTITAETGVGAVVGYGVAAIEVANMLRLWAQATAAMSSIYAVVQTLVGAIQAQVARLSVVNLPDLAGSAAYRHPLIPFTVGPR